MEKCQWEEYCRGTSERLRRVRERIASAAERSGRQDGAVQLVAVTKYGTGREGLESSLFAAGAVDFGENRVPRLIEKWHLFDERSHQSDSDPYPSSFDPRLARWHFIGSLQRNKVRRLLPYAALIHSIDTPELYDAAARIMEEENEHPSLAGQTSDSVSFPERVSVLLEVNISGEGNKHGFQPESFLEQIGPLLERNDRVDICGLMGMGGLSSSPAEVRTQFASLRELLEKVRRIWPDRTNLKELSMGMSGDFEIAIEEGATIVRIGSILYP